MAISRALKKRVEDDAKSPAYWYVPKGQAVSPANWSRIAGHLGILENFETTPWSEAQAKFAKALLKKGLIKPSQDHRDGFSAVARMQFPVWRLLGFAWINAKNEPEITDVGRRFASAKTTDEQRRILAVQLHRYQFYNPCWPEHFNSFRTFPVLALYRLMSHVDWRLYWDEFSMFGTRIRSFSDADNVAKLIDEWRRLSAQEKNQLLSVARTLSADSHSKGDDGTLGTVQRDRGYLRSLLSALPTLQQSRELLWVPEEVRKAVHALVLSAASTAQFIEYESEQDWLAVYGQFPVSSHPEQPWTTATDARAYYERVGRIDAAAEAFAKEGGRSRNELAEYRSVKILEKTLEDLLEYNLDRLESGLTLVKRQYPTPIGTIDLLAKDSNGIHVVIELKRGQTGDRVVGQVARYLTWVAGKFSGGRKDEVRGMIVGKDFDEKFSAAIEQLRRVTPFTFDLQIRIEPWAGPKKSR